MQYTRTKDQADSYAKQAMERIEQEGLAPVPRNYELWFVYFAKAHPDAVHALELLIESGKAIGDEACEEIYERFLNDKSDDKEVREAGSKIQETISDVAGQVTDLASATEKYSSVLEDATGKLNADMGADEIRQTLDGVLSNTQDMIVRNKELEAQLEQSSAAVQELQKDLENARKQALTDGLTNLANRKAFDAEIERATQNADNEGESFTLLLMDIDHFKTFNDNFGHQVGDQVLRLVARTLTDGVKGRDFAARYGGEEFAVLLPQTDLTGGVKVADSLRHTVEGKELVNRNTGEKLGRITLSGGVAEYITGESIESVIERADTALYTAKHNGRNQIAAAPASTKKAS